MKKWFVQIDSFNKRRYIEFNEDERFKSLEDCKEFFQENYKINAPEGTYTMQWWESQKCPHCTESSCLSTKQRRKMQLQERVTISFPCSTAGIEFWLMSSLTGIISKKSIYDFIEYLTQNLELFSVEAQMKIVALTALVKNEQEE